MDFPRCESNMVLSKSNYRKRGQTLVDRVVNREATRAGNASLTHSGQDWVQWPGTLTSSNGLVMPDLPAKTQPSLYLIRLTSVLPNPTSLSFASSDILRKSITNPTTISHSFVQCACACACARVCVHLFIGELVRVG